MLTKLKQKTQDMLKAQAEVAHSSHLTPNRITLMGVILAFSSALTYGMWRNHQILLLVAAILLLASGYCDALDGVVARLYGQTTVFGGFLDSMLDRYADAAVLFGLVYGGLCDVYWGLAATIGSLLVSYSRARAESADIRLETIGLAERAERLLVVVTATLVAFFWQPVTIMGWAVILLAALTNLTVVQRSVHVYLKSKKKD